MCNECVNEQEIATLFVLTIMASRDSNRTCDILAFKLKTNVLRVCQGWRIKTDTPKN